MNELKFPLTNIQIELMKLYSTNLSDTDFEELKNVLVKFYADKAIAAANEIWDNRRLTNTDMENWLNENHNIAGCN